MASVWSPAPPSPSHVAAYAATLYQGETAVGPMDFIDASASEPLGDEGPGEDPRVLLQLADEPGHGRAIRRAIEGGGVVELHDITLHAVIAQETFDRGDAGTLESLMADESRDWGRHFAMQRRKGICTRRLHTHFRLNRTICANAEAVVVHSEWARRELAALDLDTPVYVVPRFAATDAETRPERRSARRALRLPDDAFVILSFGAGGSARDWTLDAFNRIACDMPDAALAIGGAPSEASFAHALAQSPFRDRIFRFERRSEAIDGSLLAAADVVSVMRFPWTSRGSAEVAAAMGRGRLAIAPEIMAYADFDDRVCEKIELDRDPVEQLASAFASWAADPAERARREDDIADYARAHLHVDDARRSIEDILTRHWT